VRRIIPVGLSVFFHTQASKIKLVRRFNIIWHCRLRCDN